MARCEHTSSQPVIGRDIGDPLEAERILIASNDQREKTASERMHEADHLTRIFAIEAERRMLEGASVGGQTAGKGRAKGDDSPRPTLDEGYRRTDTAVAETIGMKRSTYRKTKKVYDTANDDKAPEPVRAVAQEQMAALFLAEVGVPLAGLKRDVITAQGRAEKPKFLAEDRGPHTAEERASNAYVIRNRSQYGTNADYLTARIARDHPTILEPLRSGLAGESRADGEYAREGANAHRRSSTQS